ncbi:MAG: TAT-variant-translocated molybdopterin oxidoreductase [Ignavibacteriota bacterium]
MSNPENQLDLAAVRSRLQKTSGPEYWRSLDDLSSKPEFRDMLDREFPRQALGWSEDENPAEGRRNFMKLMGASMALAGLTGCTRQPTEHIVPYVRQPEELIPGRPLFFATAATLNGVANGVLVESHEGRPTKIEGNPEHPATLGACDVFSQASVLGLYDPDRAQAVNRNGEITGWGDFFGTFREILAAQKTKKRRRHPHPHRDRHVAHHSRAIQGDPKGLSRREMAISGNPPARTALAPER